MEPAMGLTHVTTSISDLAKIGTPYEAEFLVDTGTIDCMAPADRLLAAGIQPVGKDVYELANGQPIEYEHAYAWLEFLGEKTVTRIIFGPPNVEPLLGVLALENLGMVVDPLTRKIKRLHARPLKATLQD
jgi:predicted aspartyl protease